MTVRRDERLADGPAGGSPMRPVRCLRCDTEVLVRKASWEQTSIQWGPESRTACATSPEDGFGICPALRHSISEAVRGGILKIVDE